MTEYKCPHCDIRLERINNSKTQIICPKCLDVYGKRYIMIESSPNQEYENLGGGFFQKKESE